MKFFHFQEGPSLGQVYSEAKKILNKYLGRNSSFEAFCILNFCFNLSREDFIKNKEKTVKNSEAHHFLKLVKQRAKGRPLQYILKSWSFMDEFFFVDEGVLIPREDTEVLVDASFDLLKNVKTPKILELCAGSGIVSIMLYKKIQDANIDAVEISDKAISCMKKNLKHHAADVKIIKENVLLKTKLSGKYDIIVSNPPYIPTDDIKNLEKEVKTEPKLALDGGKDGLLFYKNIAKNYFHLLKKTSKVAFEVGVNQQEAVAKILNKKGFKTKTKKDINGIERVVLARL